MLTFISGSLAETKSFFSNRHSLKLNSCLSTNTMALSSVLFFKSTRVVTHKPFRAGLGGKNERNRRNQGLTLNVQLSKLRSMRPDDNSRFRRCEAYLRFRSSPSRFCLPVAYVKRECREGIDASDFEGDVSTKEMEVFSSIFRLLRRLSRVPPPQIQQASIGVTPAYGPSSAGAAPYAEHHVLSRGSSGYNSSKSASSLYPSQFRPAASI
jgi:hypothetical protein